MTYKQGKKLRTKKISWKKIEKSLRKKTGKGKKFEEKKNEKQGGKIGKNKWEKEKSKEKTLKNEEKNKKLKTIVSDTKLQKIQWINLNAFRIGADSWWPGAKLSHGIRHFLKKIHFLWKFSQFLCFYFLINCA